MSEDEITLPAGLDVPSIAVLPTPEELVLQGLPAVVLLARQILGLFRSIPGRPFPLFHTAYHDCNN